jgi:cation transport ATPase
MGAIALVDIIREESKEAIKKLRSQLLKTRIIK